jgi:hypothetical protein
MSSQNVLGKVYDDEAIVSGAKVINRTKNTLTYTDTNGNFKVEASINDSIVFKSLFHHEKIVVLKKSDFDDSIVIELKKAINDLNEVLIKKEPDSKPFDPLETNTTMKNQILEDIKRNPHLYSKGSNGNMDFIAIAKLIAGLFKSKKPKEAAITFVSYDELVKLFKTDTYFNDQFLKTELEIEEDYKYLFYQFCEATSIESKLLLVENRFYLLDDLLKCSDAFLEILNSDQKD